MNGEYQGEYFVITVDELMKVNQIIQELISRNIQIYEVKEMEKPSGGLVKMIYIAFIKRMVKRSRAITIYFLLLSIIVLLLDI